ncbi:tetratricopeptide repeat protein, partial [Planktothrix serta]|uniref:tetratricopeptide repeat protein n=1 Tax=Planktothrix serta TaxID=1678310 RepID=UPI0009F9B07F
MSLIPGQTPSRLALFGTVLLGATFCPTLATILTGTAAPAIISTLSGMVASVFGGLVANDMGELAKRLETQDKTNHDLAKATGAAIALVILNLAEIEGIDQTVQKNLKTLALITEKEWLKVSLPETSDKVFLQIPETELVKLMSNNVEDFATVTALTKEIWLEIVNALATTAKTNFPDHWYSIIAFKLHRMFPQALREILKQDAEKGGKAYAAMSLSLMGEIAALSAERGDFSTEQITEIKAYFEQLVKGSDSQQQEFFCQLMQQVESGFAVVLEAAKQEILAEIRAGFSGVNQRLGEISEDIDQIKEILNTKPRFGVLIGGNFSGVCAYWQGREKEIEQLKDWIRDPEITLMGIEGTGGLGKTSLAEKVFDELKTEYSGYWADVSTGAIFTEVARKVLEYFNFPIPQQETELVQALISCLQQTKCLLVFDNLETLLQDNEFVIGSFYGEFFRSWTNKRSESAIVVTTRERPNIRGFNHWISLEGFEETEGAAFLQGKGIKNNQGELKAFSRLVDGYPLLLRLVADLLIDDSPQNPRLERLTELGLENLQQLLTHPDVKGNHRQREVGIVAVLDVSYQRLSEQLKTLLTAVTILRGEFDAEIALAVSGLEKTAAEIQQDLRLLVRRSWLLESENRLWSFQPVILAYLKHKAGEQTAAHLKAIDYYQNRLKPQQQWQTLDDVNEYLQIFYHYCQLGQYSLAFNTIYNQGSYTGSVNEFLDLSGYNSTRVELYHQLVENWQPEGEDENGRLSTAWQQLGNASYLLGQYSQAIKYHEKSLEIVQEIGDRRGIAASLGNLGNAYDSLGQYQRAIDFHQQSLEIEQEIGNRRGVAASLGSLGNAYQSLGQYQRAIDFHQQSLEIKQEIGNRSGVATSLNNLGNAYNSLGQYQQAIDFCQQSLEIAQEIGNRGGVANSLGGLGNAY